MDRYNRNIYSLFLFLPSLLKNSTSFKIRPQTPFILFSCLLFQIFLDCYIAILSSFFPFSSKSSMSFKTSSARSSSYFLDFHSIFWIAKAQSYAFFSLSLRKNLAFFKIPQLYILLSCLLFNFLARYSILLYLFFPFSPNSPTSSKHPQLCILFSCLVFNLLDRYAVLLSFFFPFLPGKRVWPLRISRTVTPVYRTLYVCTYRCVKRVSPSGGRAVPGRGKKGNLPKLVVRKHRSIYISPQYEVHFYVPAPDFCWCI